MKVLLQKALKRASLGNTKLTAKERKRLKRTGSAKPYRENNGKAPLYDGDLADLPLFENCYVIVGPESSGSMHISRVISFITGRCEKFGEYRGNMANSSELCENLVLHCSVPRKRPKQFQEFVESLIEHYQVVFKNVNIVLTTRDKSISTLSKIRRFGESKESARLDYEKAMPFFEKLVRDDDCFIWNYETMILLGDEYFFRLYRHLGIESDFVPEFYDGNAPYISGK